MALYLVVPYLIPLILIQILIKISILLEFNEKKGVKGR